MPITPDFNTSLPLLILGIGRNRNIIKVFRWKIAACLNDQLWPHARAVFINNQDINAWSSYRLLVVCRLAFEAVTATRL